MEAYTTKKSEHTSSCGCAEEVLDVPGGVQKAMCNLYETVADWLSRGDRPQRYAWIVTLDATTSVEKTVVIESGWQADGRQTLEIQAGLGLVEKTKRIWRFLAKFTFRGDAFAISLVRKGKKGQKKKGDEFLTHLRERKESRKVDRILLEQKQPIQGAIAYWLRPFSSLKTVWFHSNDSLSTQTSKTACVVVFHFFFSLFTFKGWSCDQIILLSIFGTRLANVKIQRNADKQP